MVGEMYARCLSMRQQVVTNKREERKVYYATSFDHPTLTHLTRRFIPPPPPQTKICTRDQMGNCITF